MGGRDGVVWGHDGCPVQLRQFLSWGGVILEFIGEYRIVLIWCGAVGASFRGIFRER